MGKDIGYQFDWLEKDRVLSTVIVYKDLSVEHKDFIDNPLERFFGYREDEVSISIIMSKLEGRCFPKYRDNCKELLEDLGLDFYNPLNIVKITHGCMCDDYNWVRFSYESHLKYKDVDPRLKIPNIKEEKL